jgi:transposase
MIATPPKDREQGRSTEHPAKANRRWKNRFSPYLYRHRNAIERSFGRLKDFRRIATRQPDMTGWPQTSSRQST